MIPVFLLFDRSSTHPYSFRTSSLLFLPPVPVHPDPDTPEYDQEQHQQDQPYAQGTNPHRDDGCR